MSLEFAVNDKDLFQFMGDIRESAGRMEANQKSFLSYLEAVNSNVKELKKDFASHVADDNEKLRVIGENIAGVIVGDKSRSEVWGVIGKVLAGFSAITAVAMGIRAIFGTR